MFILLLVQTSAEGSCRFFPTNFAVFIRHWRWVSWRIRALKKRRKVMMTISMPQWTRCYCPISSKMEEIKNTPFLKFFKFFSGDLKSSWGWILVCEQALCGRGTASGIQLKENGITLALWGALGAGDSTRDSAKGIQNPASSLGGSGGWGLE